MNSPRQYMLLLLALALAVGLLPEMAKADNPLVKPGWRIPKSNTPGNFTTNATNCDPQKLDADTQLKFGDCFNQNTLLVRLTGALAPAPHPQNSMMQFIEDIVNRKLLRAEIGGTPTTLFSNFLDLTLKRFLDGDTSTTIDYDPQTYLYRPTNYPVPPTGAGGYEAAPLLDRTCVDIPLVGSVCLNGYLFDVDGEAGQVFFSYDPNNSTFSIRPQINDDVESEFMSGSPPVCSGAACGLTANLPVPDAEKKRDDDDGLQVQLSLRDVVVDLLFEPPAEWSLTDIPSTAANYVPEKDLSTYLKAYGKARLGTVNLTLNVRVAAAFNNTVQPHVIALGFEVQNVNFDSDFQFVFNKGPYCNNNLGTTSSGAPVGQRPFNGAGTPNYTYLYAPLISDTVNNANPGNPALQYFARVASTYPTSTSRINPTIPGVNPGGGGSGVGRDRIGVDAGPYQFERVPSTGKWYMSDNPNNCRYPADACTITVAMGFPAGVTQDGGPEWNGKSASCEWEYKLGVVNGVNYDDGGNISNDSDDATYKISEQITSIIPYIQGEIQIVAEDSFKNRTRPNPGYYLGPTSLLDLGATLAGISFDWPLRPGTDYVFIDALLSSDVDNDSTNEFWADDWGVMMPFNFALGVSWNATPFLVTGVADRIDLKSCVQKLKVMTGYIDGAGEFLPNTTTPRTDDGAGQDGNDDPFLTKPLAPKAMRAGAITASKRGLLAGFDFPNVVTPNANEAALSVTPSTGAYALGVGIHQNVLSAALYDAVIKGLLCADIDATGQYATVTDQVIDPTSLLNTSTFELFFPALAQQFPNRPMRMRVIPLLDRYTHNSACAGGNCSNGISGFAVTDVVNQKPYLTQANASVPYVIMGGPPIQLALANQYIWPDLSVVIPNLLIEFYVYGKDASDTNWYRVFAVDLGVVIGLNIDIVKTPTTFPNLPTVAVANQATYFPIGCNPAAPQGRPDYCSGGYAYTKRVIRLAGLADPEINAIIEYSELSFGNANGTNSGGNNFGEGVDYTGTVHNIGTEPKFHDPAVFKAAISNLIGLALSMDLSALVEIGFDLGAFLNIPLVFDAPYIGPSFAIYPGAPTNGTDREYPTGNGFGDYLMAGISLDLSALSSSYLIQQIDYLLDGTDATAPFGLSGLGFSPQQGGAKLPEAISVPQAIVQPPLKVSATETIFKFSGYDAQDGSNLRYSWRVDNGVWTVFDESTEARITGLLEGKHTFEVKAINSRNMMQDVPARYTFVVDSIAPKVRVVGDRTVGSRASFFVEANDWLTPKEDIRVAYRLDDGRWSNFGYNKKIVLSGLREGRHTLRVKAVDNAGNAAETAFNFSAADSGFGCATVGGGSMGDALVLLLVPALVLLRRRLP